MVAIQECPKVESPCPVRVTLLSKVSCEIEGCFFRAVIGKQRQKGVQQNTECRMLQYYSWDRLSMFKILSGPAKVVVSTFCTSCISFFLAD